MSTICGWFSFPASDASATNDLCTMRSSCASACLSNWNTLMATSRLAKGSRARYTLLVAPLPISLVTGYLPTFMGRISYPSECGDLLEELGLLIGLAQVGIDPEV